MSGSINLTENAVTRIQGLSAGSDNDKFRVNNILLISIITIKCLLFNAQKTTKWKNIKI